MRRVRSCRSGGIGRHAVLRGQWRKLCRFESGLRHQAIEMKRDIAFTLELGTFKVRRPVIPAFAGMTGNPGDDGIFPIFNREWDNRARDQNYAPTLFAHFAFYRFWAWVFSLASCVWVSSLSHTP